MADVAAIAGVSLNTVSLALRAPQRVAENTRKHVEAAVSRVGYVPNRLAGALAAQRSDIVVSIIPTMITRIYADYTEGLASALEQGGLRLLIGTTDYDLAREESLLRVFSSYRPTAIVTAGLLHSAGSVQLLSRLDVPIVETGNLVPSPLWSNVGFSNFDAMALLTRRLIEQGRRRIAYVTTGYGENDRYRDRLAGFMAATAQASLPKPSIHTAEFSYAGGGAVLSTIMRKAPDTDGVVFSTDIPAIGALIAARKAGIAVPEDVAVVGFGDPELAALVEPGLTTIRADFRGLGIATGELIGRQLESGLATRESHDIGFELVARGSG
jgi:LacI family gluconate utilization system Gnt-I transcriptional repressor